jgi:hypothetical protein
MQGLDAIAVRDPNAHWGGEKVLFSMAIGAPTQRYQTKEYRWQLYEITNLRPNQTPVITKVVNQPTQYNNVMPIYGTDGRIIFVSDRPRNNQIHLYPQLDEYESTASNTGLWSLDSSNGDLFLLDHSPSGDFHPSIDSFGRVIFTRWDHLQRDQQNLPEYGPFNYSSENINSEPTISKLEVYPEPRSINDPDKKPNVNLFTINHFFPWMVSEKGTGLETLNHIGRQELHDYIEKSFKDDPAPLSDGGLLAVHTAFTGGDSNIGTGAQPLSKYDFRIKSLKKIGAYWVPDEPITPGIRKTISFWEPDILVSYNEVQMWELQPVELRARIKPAENNHALKDPEQNAFN